MTALLRIILLYNSLIDTRNRMRQGFSQIDVQLHRRASLIPNLVDSVKAIASHEKDVQTLIAEIRAEANATPPGKRGTNPHPILPKLRALAEQYPKLVADDHFLRLKEELTETEQRIALARAYFNDIATEWNNRVEQFPDFLLAKLARFKKQSLFETETFERAPLNVDFAK